MLYFSLFFYFLTGSALRCWECSSHMNAMCGDPMNTTEHQAIFHVKECGRGPYASSKPICRKMVKRGMFCILEIKIIKV